MQLNYLTVLATKVMSERHSRMVAVHQPPTRINAATPTESMALTATTRLQPLANCSCMWLFSFFENLKVTRQMTEFTYSGVDECPPARNDPSLESSAMLEQLNL